MIRLLYTIRLLYKLSCISTIIYYSNYYLIVTYHAIISDRDRLLGGFKGRDGRHRSKDLFLEHSHLVVTLEDGRLHVVTTVHYIIYLTTTQHLS